MTWKKPPPRSKQYEGANPSKSRVASVRIMETREVLVMPIEKESPVRSESYWRFVAAQPCFGCGTEGQSQAAHPNMSKGLGIKTSDLLCFPLCVSRFGKVGCHQLHDQRVEIGRHESREIEAAYVQRMQRIAKAAGRKELVKEEE